MAILTNINREKALSANRVLVTSESGTKTVSSVTTGELYQLHGIKTDKNIQTQLDAKAETSVVGAQSVLPLPGSSFAYNIAKNAEAITDNTNDIEYIQKNYATNEVIEDIFEDLEGKAETNVVGAQSVLPLPGNS